MIYDNMFLTISEPTIKDGSRRKQRHYEIKTADGRVLAIEDLAARIGRKPPSIYNLLRNLPIGIHAANFQDIIRKSAARKYQRRPQRHGIVAASDLGVAVEAVIARLRCEPTCALERWQARVATHHMNMQIFLAAYNDWRQLEEARKAERAAGRGVPSVAPPVRPPIAQDPVPACNCGREADVIAVRAALDRCDVQPDLEV